MAIFKVFIKSDPKAAEMRAVDVREVQDLGFDQESNRTLRIEKTNGTWEEVRLYDNYDRAFLENDAGKTCCRFEGARRS